MATYEDVLDTRQTSNTRPRQRVDRYRPLDKAELRDAARGHHIGAHSISCFPSSSWNYDFMCSAFLFARKVWSRSLSSTRETASSPKPSHLDDNTDA